MLENITKEWSFSFFNHVKAAPSRSKDSTSQRHSLTATWKFDPNHAADSVARISRTGFVARLKCDSIY